MLPSFNLCNLSNSIHLIASHCYIDIGSKRRHQRGHTNFAERRNFRSRKSCNPTGMKYHIFVPLLKTSKLIFKFFSRLFARQLLSKCIMKSRREARNEKDMYQKMLGQTQKLEGKEKHSKHSGAQDAPKV